MTSLLCLGFGYCAAALAELVAPMGWQVAGTSRTQAGAERIRALGYTAHVLDGTAVAADDLRGAVGRVRHVLVSIPPDADGDPVLRAFAVDIRRAPALASIDYLSTVGVYGDSGGAWVDEETAPAPSHERTIARVEAERAWLDLAESMVASVRVFRLAGIYGPGRNPLLNVLDGSARRIVKPGQVFNRIHVADIARTVLAGIERGHHRRVYNVSDDEPAPRDEVVAYAAKLLGVPPPPAVAFADAKLSPMAASFYAGNRRVRNQRIKQELGVELRYPTYREGLAALLPGVRQQGPT